MAENRIISSLIVDEDDAFTKPTADGDLVIWELLDTFLMPAVRRPVQEFEIEEDAGEALVRWHVWTRTEGDILLRIGRTACAAAGWDISAEALYELREID